MRRQLGKPPPSRIPGEFSRFQCNKATNDIATPGIPRHPSKTPGQFSKFQNEI